METVVFKKKNRNRNSYSSEKYTTSKRNRITTLVWVINLHTDRRLNVRRELNFLSAQYCLVQGTDSNEMSYKHNRFHHSNVHVIHVAINKNNIKYRYIA